MNIEEIYSYLSFVQPRFEDGCYEHIKIAGDGR